MESTDAIRRKNQLKTPKINVSDRKLFNKKELATNIMRASSMMCLKLDIHYGFGLKNIDFEQQHCKTKKLMISIVFHWFWSKTTNIHVFLTKTIVSVQLWKHRSRSPDNIFSQFIFCWEALDLKHLFPVFSVHPCTGLRR